MPAYPSCFVHRSPGNSDTHATNCAALSLQQTAPPALGKYRAMLPAFYTSFKHELAAATAGKLQ